MRIWRSLEDVPSSLGRTVVTIGNFDGVHRGHQRVVARAREVAAALGGLPVVALTFDPHPIAVLRPDHAPRSLTTVDERAEALAEHGVDQVAVLPFSREVAAWPAERFVAEVLAGALHARAVVVGANFRFGAKASGDLATLREQGARHDFDTHGVELDGGPQVWSSTYVRTCLASGDVSGAAEALGRPFALRGTVVEGDRRGRELGYPTANVPVVGERAVPEDGVYAGWLRRLEGDPTLLPVAISVGTNPTFAGERARRIESYVLPEAAGDDLDLYGATVEVSFVARVRPMARFDDVDQLVEQMADDVGRTRRLLDLPEPT